MSPIPDRFQFSQNNMQDYFDCARRFELRHLVRLEWPALQSEPVMEMEHRSALGRHFHEMVYQSILGVPEEQIAAQTDDPELRAWWDEFSRSTILQNLPAKRKPEFTLSAPFEGFRLVAKFDLIAIESGIRAVIVDWKTSNKPLPASYLVKRLQTRIYPFLWVESGRLLNNGDPIVPEQVEMIYWFTSDPDHPVHFHYNSKQFQADKIYLSAMVREIVTHTPGSFPLTLDEKKCTYCVYRSLCNRGIRAGGWDGAVEEVEPDVPLEISFDQIGEIEF